MGIRSENYLPGNVLEKMRPEDRKSLGRRGWLIPEWKSAAEYKLEKDLQRDVRGYLMIHGAEFIQAPFGKKSSLPPGWPDFSIFLWAKTTIFWECKVCKNDLDPDQIKVRAALVAKGHIYRVIRSVVDCRDHLREGGLSPLCETTKGD